MLYIEEALTELWKEALAATDKALLAEVAAKSQQKLLTAKENEVYKAREALSCAQDVCESYENQSIILNEEAAKARSSADALWGKLHKLAMAEVSGA